MKKQLFAIATIAVILFASCAKNEDAGNIGDNQAKNITLSFSNAPAQGLRTIEGSASNMTTTFSTGQIIFANGTQVSDVYTIGSGATNLETKQVRINDLTDGVGVTFTGIKATAVYVVGNHTISGMAVGKLVSSDVLKAQLTTAQLKDGSFENAVLYGTAGVDAPVSPATNHSANVIVSPVAARFEIGGLTNISASRDYTFELAGIYINNYYPTMEIAAATGNGTKTFNEAGEFTTTQYPGTTSTFHNTFIGLTANDTYSPVPGEVWAYQMFPAASLTAGDDMLPHIIVHMTNLKKGTEPVHTDYYLTIRTYGTTTEILGGRVYTISGIDFDASEHGDIIPESELIDCDMTMEVAMWVPVPLTPDIN